MFRFSFMTEDEHRWVSTKGSSKGHAEQVAAWLKYLKGETPHPLPYEQSRQAMRLTFAALESIQKSCAVEL